MRQRIDTEGWARHAGASNGFADLALAADAFAPRARSRMASAGGGPGARRLGELIVAAARATLAWLRAANERRRQRGAARAMYEALRGLDDRTLQDLGFSRSEIGSVAAEASGLAERTRAHTLHTTYGLPG